MCSAAATASLAWLISGVVKPEAHLLELQIAVELVAAVAATAIMARSIDRREWSYMGLSRSAAQPSLLVTGWCVGMVGIALACVLLLAGGWLDILQTGSGGSWAAAALRTTVILTIAAFAEELICRGYLLSIVRDSVGVRGAVLLTSAFFGLLHLFNPGATAQSVAVVTLAGVLLATVRLALKSLYAAWMAHLGWNWLMAVPLHASVSGERFESPGYVAVATGPTWLSGGPWGPEGGVVAAACMVAGIAYLYTRHRREESSHDG